MAKTPAESAPGTPIRAFMKTVCCSTWHHFRWLTAATWCPSEGSQAASRPEPAPTSNQTGLFRQISPEPIVDLCRSRRRLAEDTDQSITQLDREDVYGARARTNNFEGRFERLVAADFCFVLDAIRLDCFHPTRYTDHNHGTLLPYLRSGARERKVFRTGASGPHLQGLPAPAA